MGGLHKATAEELGATAMPLLDCSFWMATALCYIVLVGWSLLNYWRNCLLDSLLLLPFAACPTVLGLRVGAENRQ